MKVKFLGNYSEDSKKMLLVLVIGIALVLGISLYLLQQIWGKNKENNAVDSQADNQDTVEELQNDLKLGSYSNVTNGRSLILKEYFTDIFRLLSSGTKDEIYKVVSKDYLIKYGYDSTSLYNKLQSKQMVGKAFESKSYSYAKNPRFGNIYSLEISSIDNKVLDKLLIIEDKPRSYKLSFESYIGKKAQDVSVIYEGVRLNITSVEEYRDRVYFDIQIKNLNENEIILNYGGTANEAIYAELKDGSKIYNILSFFSSKEIKLRKEESVEGKIEFLINDLQSADINKICLVNVYNTQSQTKSNYEYKVY